MSEDDKRNTTQKYYSDKEFEKDALAIMGKFSNIEEHQNPTIIVVGKNSKGEAKAMELDLTVRDVDVDWTDYDSKAAALRSAGQSYFHLFKGDYAPFAVFMVTEAWGKMLKTDKDGNPPKIDRPVREYKDKSELFVISAMTIDGRSKFTYTDIERLDDQEEGKIRLGEFMSMGDGDNSELTDNLLPNFYRGYGELYLTKEK